MSSLIEIVGTLIEIADLPATIDVEVPLQGTSNALHPFVAVLDATDALLGLTNGTVSITAVMTPT